MLTHNPSLTTQKSPCSHLSALVFTYYSLKLLFSLVGSTSLLKNTVGKGELVRNDHFLLVQQCFLPVFENFLQFPFSSKLSSANSFSLE